MLKITKLLSNDKNHSLTLTLPFDSRQKARLQTKLDNGQDAGLFLPRGIILRNGNKVEAESGEIIKIISANEDVSTVTTTDTLLLIRASYHLGNRHVPLEVTKKYLRYQYDHVLNEMIEQLQLTVTRESAPFEPESGAYSHGHHHSHE